MATDISTEFYTQTTMSVHFVPTKEFEALARKCRVTKIRQLGDDPHCRVFELKIGQIEIAIFEK